MGKRKGRQRNADAPRGSSGRIKTSFYRQNRTALREQIAGQAKVDADAIRGWRLQQHLALRSALDPRMNTVLGRMLVWGDPARIGPEEMEAGQRVAQLLFEYERKILGTVSTPQAIDMARVRGLALTDDDPARIARIRESYGRLTESLGSRRRQGFEAGNAASVRRGEWYASAQMRALRQLCFEDEAPAEINLAIEALRIVADDMRLYDNANQRVRRWRDGEAQAAVDARVLHPEGWQQDGQNGGPETVEG